MACDCENNPCSGKPNCTCPVKDLSTDCSIYNGPDLECSGVESKTILTKVIQKLDEFICNKFDEAVQYLSLVNVGAGAKVFKGISGNGNRQFRSLLSGDTNLMDVTEDSDTINFTPGTHRMEIDGGTSTINLYVNTLSGDTLLSSIPLGSIIGGINDSFVDGITVNETTGVVTVTRNNGLGDLTFDLSFLDVDTFLSSGSYSTNTITLTLNDSSQVDVDVTSLVNEILNAAADAQVQSDFTESDNTQASFIQNKNPQKTVVLGAGATYSVQNADNNHIIEVDNSSNKVYINLTSITNTANMHVEFIPKGSGDVTILGANQIKAGFTNLVAGQGHVARVSVINGTKYLHGSLTANSGTPPVAEAGANQTIEEPTSQVTLDGASSTDSDGTIVSYLWTYISGPAGYTITSPNASTTTVTNLEEGTYVFQLTVTDNDGNSDIDTVTITVDPLPMSSFDGVVEVDDCNDTSGTNTLVDYDTTDVGGQFLLAGTSTPFNGGGNSFLLTAGGANQFYNPITLPISTFILTIDASGVVTSKTPC